MQAPIQEFRPPTSVPANPAPLPSSELRFKTGERHRVHHAYIWLGALTAFALVIAVVAISNLSLIIEIANVMLDDSGQILLALGVGLLALLAVFGLLLGVHALAWKNMSYAFDEGEFSLHSGIITKRRAHVPYARVQSVNHRAGILQRIFGLCTVSIDTAGGASNKAVKLPYVELETAELVRRELFLRKALSARMDAAPGVPESAASPQAAAVQAVAASTAPPAVSTSPLAASDPNMLDDAFGVVGEWRGAWGGAVPGMEPVSFEARLGNEALLLTALSHESSTVLAGSFGICALVVLAALVFESPIFVALLLPIAIGSAVAGLLIGTAINALSYGGFAARRRGSRIEVERGLLQREFSGIDIERVQSVSIRQSFVKRCLGYCEVSVGRISAVGDAQEQQGRSSGGQGLVVHPFLKLDQVEALLAGLLPEFEGRPTLGGAIPPAPVALRRALIRRCIWQGLGFWGLVMVALALLALQALLLVSPGLRLEAANGIVGFYAVCACLVLVCLVASVLSAVSAVLWYRGSGMVWNRSYLVVKNDGLRTDLCIIPRTKLQNATSVQNPLQRLSKVATARATTAAGTRSTTVGLRDLAQEHADAYLDWAQPRPASQRVA